MSPGGPFTYGPFTIGPFTYGPFSYGKAGVRFLQVDRSGSTEQVREVTARVRLTGGIDEAYVEGDNAAMVTTDALADLVQERCGQLAGAAPEVMAVAAVAALSERYPHLPDVAVSLDVRPLEPVAGGRAHVRSAADVAGATARRRGTVIRCHARLRGLSLVRTSGSRFEGFLVDRYTTTRPAADRAVGGAVDARWEPAGDGEGVDWAALRAAVRGALVTAFATEDSASVQQLVFLMARRALLAEPGPEAIDVRLAGLRLSSPTLPGSKARRAGLGGDGSGDGTPEPSGSRESTAGRTLGLAEVPRGEVRVRLTRQAAGALGRPEVSGRPGW